MMSDKAKGHCRIFHLVPKYFIISLAIIFGLVFFIHRIENADIWYHLKTGEYILKNHTIVHQDIFSYTALGNQWINHQWLSQVLFYLIFKNFGFKGVILFSALIMNAALFLLASIAYKKSNYIVTTLLFILTIFYSVLFIPIRPLIFTYFFAALYFYILYTYKYRDKNFIYILPLLQVIWANLHASFLLGIVLIFFYLFGELIMWKTKVFNQEKIIKNHKYYKLLIIGIISILVSLLNPNGYRLFLYPTYLLKSKLFLMHLTEWTSIFQYRSSPPPTLLYYKIIIIVLMSTFLLNIKRINASHLIIFCGLFYLSLNSRRNVPLFLFLSFPLVCLNIFTLERFIKRLRLKYFLTPLNIIIRVIIIMFMVIKISDVVSDRLYVKLNLNRRFGFGFTEYPFSYLDEACNFIEDNGIKGNIFNEFDIGDYLIWRFFPKRKVFIDGRPLVYGENFFSDYKEVLINPQGWGNLVAKYDINYALLHCASPSASNLLIKLYRDKNWILIYLNNNSVIFIKNTDLNSDIIKKYQIHFISQDRYRPEMLIEKESSQSIQKKDHIYTDKPFFFKNIFQKQIFPTGHYNKAVFFTTIGLYEHAIKEYKEALNLNPDIALIHNNLGQIYFNKGMLDEALHEFRISIALDRNLVEAYNNIGSVYGRKGRYRMAIEYFKKVIKINPNNVELYNNLGLAYGKLALYDKSIKYYKKAIKIDPENINAYYNIGITFAKMGKLDKAIENWQRALDINPEFKGAKLQIEKAKRVLK